MAEDDEVFSERGLSETLDSILGRDRTPSTSTSSVNIDTLYARGRNALLTGQFADAVRAFQEVVDRKPNHSWAHYLLGRAHHPLGNKTQAERHFRRAVALRPAFSLENITDAQRHLSKKEYTPALWAAERAAIVARYTSAPDATLRTIAEALNTVGAAFKEGKETPKNIAKAKQAFEAATRADPQYVHPYYHLGTIARIEKDYQTAEEHLKKVIVTNPHHSWAHYQLGTVYEALGKNQDAREAYQHAAALGHKEAQAYLFALKDSVDLTPPQTRPVLKRRPLVDRSSPKKMNDYTPLESIVQELDGTTFRDSSWMKDQRVSIIIPTYNRKEYLRKTLLALGQQTYPLENMEIIIADDGSSDGTHDMVKAMDLPFRVKYIWQQDEGFRVAKVRNEGMKVASHDHVILLDNDMLPKPTLVEKHMRWHYAADALDVDAMFIGRRLFAEISDVTDDKIKNRELDTVPIATHARTRSSVDWRETNRYPQTNNLKDLSGFSDPEWVMSSTVCSGNISFKKDRAFAAGLFDEHFKAWGREDKYFGDSFFYSQAQYPDKPLYFIPLLDAEAFHLEHPVNTKTRREDIGRTNRLYKGKLEEIRAKTFFRSPKVSVYIPAWNAEQFIEQTIESVRAQTYKDVEVCVVEDRGDDNTWSVLERLAEQCNIPGERPFLRIERNEKNSGIGPTSNRAVRMCTGEYILQLDSDDWLSPKAIQTLVGILDKNPDVGLVFGDCMNVLPDGTQQPHWSPPDFTEEFIVQYGYQHSLNRLWDAGMRVTHPRMFRRSAFYQTEGFAEDIVNAIDYDIYTKLSEVTGVRHIPERLYFYRTNHGKNTSVTKSEAQKRNARIVTERGNARRAQAMHFQYSEVKETTQEKNVAPVATQKIEYNPALSSLGHTVQQPVVSVYSPLSPENVRYAAGSLDSILAQSLARLTEVSICFDGTHAEADALFTLLEKRYGSYDFENPQSRIKVAVHGQKRGAAATSNTAIEKCRGKYVLQLDPDDRLADCYALEKLARVLEKDPSIGLIYADYWLIDQNGNRIGKWPQEGAFSSRLLRQGYNQIGLRMWRHETLEGIRTVDGAVEGTPDPHGKIFDESLKVAYDFPVLIKADHLLQRRDMHIAHYTGEPINGMVGRVLGTLGFGYLAGSSYLAEYRQHAEADSSRYPDLQRAVVQQQVERTKNCQL